MGGGSEMGRGGASGESGKAWSAVGGKGAAGLGVDRRGAGAGGGRRRCSAGPARPPSPRPRVPAQPPPASGAAHPGTRGWGGVCSGNPRRPGCPRKFGLRGAPAPLAGPGPEAVVGGLGGWGAGVAGLRARRWRAGRVPGRHCDLAEREPNARPCHCSPGSSSQEARPRSFVCFCFPFFSGGACKSSPCPPRHLPGSSRRALQAHTVLQRGRDGRK